MIATIKDRSDEAKQLREAFLRGDGEAAARVEAAHPKGSSIVREGKMTHLDARSVVARENGALNWQRLEQHTLDCEFALAIEHLDVKSVKSCLKKDPSLMEREIPAIDGKFATPPLSYVANVSLYQGHHGESAATASAMLETGLVDSERLGYAMDQACSLGAEDMALVLVEAGADVNQSTIYDATALHWAVNNGMPKLVEALVKRGADLERKCSHWGGTPLWWAVRPVGTRWIADLGDREASIRMAIELGANTAATSKDGRSIYDVSRKHAETRKLIDEAVDPTST